MGDLGGVRVIDCTFQTSSDSSGINGIIKEDRLGLDAIYIQAKRWNNTVGRPEIQQFVGALAGKGARKGIFITTSKFSEQAKSYLPANVKVVLIVGVASPWRMGHS